MPPRSVGFQSRLLGRDTFLEALENELAFCLEPDRLDFLLAHRGIPGVED